MPTSDTDLTFYGMWHLVGRTVQASVGGLDCGDYTVAADGSITVPFGSDAQGLMTPYFLVSLDGYTGDNAAAASFIVDDAPVSITIPVFIGLGYTSKGQGLRPALEVDTGVKTDNALGKFRRAHVYAALLHNSIQISFGTDFTTMDDVALTTTDGETDWPRTSLYSGVYKAVLTDQYGFDSMLSWQVNRPWPATLLAVSSMIMAEP